MNLLLSTEVLIWALVDDPKLSKKAKKLILDPDNEIHFSSVSLLEIALLHNSSSDNTNLSGKQLMQYCEKAGFIHVEIQDKHLFAVEALKVKDSLPYHDPFIPLLIAQAKEEKMLLIAHHSLYSHYKEKCIELV